MLTKTVITAVHVLNAGFNWYSLYGDVESRIIEGFRINSVSYSSASGQPAGFVVLCKDIPLVLSIEIIDTREVISSTVNNISGFETDNYISAQGLSLQ